MRSPFIFIISAALLSGCGDGSNTNPGDPDASTGESFDSSVVSPPDATPDATPELECGNGVVDEGEECDEGGETASCDADCTAVECGDAYLNWFAGERCDDGNQADGDACDAACAVVVFDVDAAASSTGAMGNLLQPDVAASNDQFFVVSSREISQDLVDVRLRIYDRVGVPVGPPVILRDGTRATHPRIATSSTGAAVVAWLGTGKVPSIEYHRLEPDGTPAAAGVQFLSSNIRAAAPAVATHGDVTCIQWIGVDRLVLFQCLDANGDPDGQAEILGSATTTDLSSLAGAHDLIATSSGFVSIFITWDNEVVGQRIDGSGTPIGEPFVITDLAAAEVSVLVGDGYAAPGGDAFVSAHAINASFGQEGSQLRALVRAMSATSTPLGPDQLVNTAHNREIGPNLVGNDERILAMWAAAEGPESGCDLLARRGMVDGSFSAAPFPLRPTTGGECAVFPRAAANSSGDTFIVWTMNVPQGELGIVRTEAILHPRLLQE